MVGDENASAQREQHQLQDLRSCSAAQPPPRAIFLLDVLLATMATVQAMSSSGMKPYVAFGIQRGRQPGPLIFPWLES